MQTVQPAEQTTRSRWPTRRRTALLWVLTAVGAGLVWFALVGPDDLERLAPMTFVRLPLEPVLFALLVLVLPPRTRLVVSLLAGGVLGLLAILKVLDMGFIAALGRPFDPLVDAGYFSSAVDLLADSVGRTRALVATAALGVGAVAVLALAALATSRLTGLLARHRRSSFRAAAVLGLVWVLCAWSGVQVGGRLPVATTSGAQRAYGEVRLAWAASGDRREFARALADDPLADATADDLLTGLRGKDVLLVFVESYGRVAVEDSELSGPVQQLLDDGSRRLEAAGFGSRSAFLTSPTYGGISWLAHSTLQSGVWVDNQVRYSSLLGSDRFTLSQAFERAGWRTVADVPANARDWPEGRAFYGYDQVYDSTNVGYAGPKFSYATMPDQFVLNEFRERELDRRRGAPVMAEIDLVSSHTPWAPLPRPVDWDDVGDGSVFAGMPAQGQEPEEVWPDAGRVRAAYGDSIEYTLQTLISFVERYGDDDLVMVVLGDHQPASIVTGTGASHDVPISVIARDPDVLGRVAGWGWRPGLRPAGDDPVWPMDEFRDRFLTAFSAPGLESR